MSNSAEFSLPHDFSVAAFENRNQGLLRQEFDELALQNRRYIESFDPHVLDSPQAALRLTTVFTDAEEEESQIAESLRQNMLASLGLTSAARIAEEDNARAWSGEDPDGNYHQMHYLARPDGVTVPVHSAFYRHEDDTYTLASIQLESHTWAEERLAEAEHARQEYEADTRLHAEFELNKDFLDASGLTLEDKQGLLAAYDSIQSMQTTPETPDLSKLDGLRQRLVKSMLPSAEFFSNKQRLTKRQEQYLNELSYVLEKCEDPQLGADILQRERLLRLQAENARLQIRKRTAWLGAIATTSLATVSMTAIGVGGGIAGADALPPQLSPVVTGVIGGLSGLAVGLEQIHKLHSNRHHIHDFTDLPSSPYNNIYDELEQERRTAHNFFHLTRRH